MEELRTQTLDLLSSLSPEEIQLVLAYAQTLKEPDQARDASGLEDLVDDPS